MRTIFSAQLHSLPIRRTQITSIDEQRAMRPPGPPRAKTGSLVVRRRCLLLQPLRLLPMALLRRPNARLIGDQIAIACSSRSRRPRRSTVPGSCRQPHRRVCDCTYRGRTWSTVDCAVARRLTRTRRPKARLPCGNRLTI